MKKAVFFIVTTAAVMMASCGQSDAEREALARVDSLTAVVEQRDAEIDEMFATFNEIEEGFKEINEAEGRVNVARTGEGASRTQRIQENMQFIQSTMAQNRQLIAKLQKQLKDSNYKGEQLKKTIETLTAQLAEKDTELAQLRTELEAKNIHIAELDSTITGLNADVSSLQQENSEQAGKISSQDTELHTAYYAYGTKKELAAQNIFGNGKKKNLLTDNFNKDFFTKIDIRQTKEIKLYSKSAEVLTTHPATSYTLERDDNNQYVLTIKDANTFWSTSRYLVVQVK